MMKIARILARRRVPLGFFCAILVIWIADPTGLSVMLGATVAVAGELLRIWAAGHLNKAREVTTSGPYRWLAHPLYVGSSIMGVGLAIASGSLIVTGIIAAYLVTTMTAAIRSEEAFLREKFGERYDRYRRGDRESERRRFSVSQAIVNHEHQAVAGLLLAVLLLALKATYNGTFWRSGAGH